MTVDINIYYLKNVNILHLYQHAMWNPDFQELKDTKVDDAQANGDQYTMSVRAVTVTVLILEAIAFEMMDVILVLAGRQVCRNM